MSDFLGGAAAATSWIVAMFLFKFWRESRDRLLLLFSLAFLMLGVNWLLVSAVHPGTETRHLFYAVRLVAFLLILVAILDKNRRGPSSP
jgi:O-antigen/teichoic acid export membrane protein